MPTEVMTALIAHPAGSVLARSGFLLAIAIAVLIVLPLRGGHGQHAHAGPGTVSVWHLREILATGGQQLSANIHQFAATPEPDTEDIVWPEHDWPHTEAFHFVARHRVLQIDFGLPLAGIRARFGTDFPWCAPHYAC